MAEPGPPGAGAPACHIVCMEARGTTTKGRAVCATLDRATIEEVSELAAGWRDPQHVARHLERLRDRERLSGIAVWLQLPKDHTALPAPLGVPIEPLVLDESAAPLADICGVVAGESAPTPRLSSRWRRFSIRFGIPLAVLLPQVCNAIGQIAAQRSRFVVWLWMAIIATILAAGLLAWFLSDQWLLIPGGIVIRKSLFRKVGETLTRYTPRDTVLVVRAHPPGYQIDLWRGASVKRQRVTRVELLAALAAWQSPLPAPDVRQLSDFE